MYKPAKEDVLTASGGYKDVSFFAGLIHGGHLIACGMRAIRQPIKIFYSEIEINYSETSLACGYSNLQNTVLIHTCFNNKVGS